MSDTPSAISPPLPSFSLGKLRQRCSRFELSWKTGQAPKIEEYLETESVKEAMVLLKALIQLDIFYRRRSGHDPKPEDYFPRFPNLDGEWLENAICSLSSAEADPLSSLGQALRTVAPDGGLTAPPDSVLCCPQCRHPLPTPEKSSQNVVCGECGNSFRFEQGTGQTTQDEYRQVGRFQLLERVGKGGFGAVWRARDLELDRIVALKFPHPNLFSSAIYEQRFHREARAAAQLRHPGIVRLYEVATLEEGPVLVSDFIEGISLKELLEVRQLTFRESAQLVAEVAEALDYAHDMGLVHRDIKPGNIMMEYGRRLAVEPRCSPSPESSDKVLGLGKPIVVDFGLARRGEAESVMTVEGQILGTPAYMSPEQAAGKSHQVDRRSDVYSLGVVLYQLLTGEMPFRGSTAMLMHQVLRKEPRPPRKFNDRIPRDLETICLKAMAKHPGGRFGTARALADDLRRFLRNEPIQARPAGQLERLARWCQRNPAIAFWGGTAAFLLVAGTLIASYFAIQASKGEQTALRYAGEAKAKQRFSDCQRYDAEMNQVFPALEKGQISKAEELLQRQEPQHADFDWRGFDWHYLKRLSQPELETLRGHAGTVRSLAFSPTGRWLASAGDDHTIRIWDMAGEQEPRVLSGHSQPILSIVFSADGHLLASASREYDRDGKALPGEVKIWDMASGQEVPFLPRQQPSVMAVAFSPDSHRLAGACEGQDLGGFPGPGAVKVWDLGTKQLLLTFKGHQRSVRCVAFSPDRHRLAAGGDDMTVQVWDAANTKDPVHTFHHSGPVQRVVFSSDGRRLAAADYSNTIMIWDFSPGKPPLILLGHSAPVQDLAFSPDGRHLVSASRDRTVKIWETAKGTETATLRGHTQEVFCVGFSPDGWRLASGSADQTIKLWKLPTAAESATLHGHCNHIHNVAFSADGKWLASASHDRTVKIWDPDLGLLSLVLRGHMGSVQSVAFSPKGRFLASGSIDRTVRIWDVATGANTHTWTGHTQAVTSVAYHSTGRLVASGGLDQTIKVWSFDRGKEPLTLPGHTAPVRGVAFSLDGTLLASASDDHTVKIWNPVTGVEIRTLSGHTDSVSSVTFSRDGPLLASGSKDQSVRIWDPVTGQEDRILRGHTGPVWSVTFSPDGRRLASASGDQTVKIWDTETSQEILTLPGHQGQVFCVAFSADGERLASGGQDHVVKIWDATPLTLDLRNQQEALSLVAYLFGQKFPEVEVRSRIRDDVTIGNPVREHALNLVGAYWTNLVRRDADRLVHSFSHGSALRQEIKEQIQNEKGINNLVRQEALRMAEHYVENPDILNQASREIVRRRQQDAQAYTLALRKSETACRLAPKDGCFRTTLALAQFRLGRYEEAMISLQQTGQTNPTPGPTDLAVLAMVQNQLGRNDEAHDSLRRLREIMQQPQWAKQVEAQALWHEAKDLLSGKSNGPQK